MGRLGETWWGKSEIRVSKVDRGDPEHGFSDVTVQVLLGNDGESTHLVGDNTSVLPTDTMRNTVYGMAQEHLGPDLEGFATRIAERFVSREDVIRARVAVAEKRWQRLTGTGFLGGGSERRTARVSVGEGDDATWAGIEGLVVLKTSGSAFSGFPRDEYTILPDAEDRLLATSVSAEWRYAAPPGDTAQAWSSAREAMVASFFAETSLSLQHQGWMMAAAALDAVPEIASLRLRLPNQHHLGFDLARFGIDDRGVVFQPVTEPYGDISLTVER
jgi:urate oxidase